MKLRCGVVDVYSSKLDDKLRVRGKRHYGTYRNKGLAFRRMIQVEMSSRPKREKT